jgi:hypothetical protein
VNKVFGNVPALLPIVLVLALLMVAQSKPGYFSNEQYLAGALFLQILAICLWFYDQLFFPLLMIAFLWAGTDVPMSGLWTAARWAVLGVGAFVGVLRSIRLGRQQYNSFHLVSFLCVASALVSAMVSALPGFSVLKAMSLFFLFLYGSAGARLVLCDPDRFFRGLVLACEINVYATAVLYFALGQEVWGNRNSMGAVEGVIAAPLLLWGALVTSEKSLRARRVIAFVGATYLIYFSLTRAAFLATGVSILLLLLGARHHRLLLKGIVATACVLAVSALVAPGSFNDLKASFIEGVVYKGHQTEGLLGSRRTPWQETAAAIRNHPYFGSGFGTSITYEQPFGEVSNFRSSSDTTREHGSSYLSIIEWMGLLGILPFALLITLLTITLLRVFLWMRKTGTASHYSVPIMMVLSAGLVHALFEDWMFAVGYYLTVLFWNFAFLLMDLAPEIREHPGISVQGMRFRVRLNTAADRPALPMPAFSGMQRDR